MERKKLYGIAYKNCPSDSPDDPAFPNHTDSDIWANGFVQGIEYVLNISESFKYSLIALIEKHECNSNTVR